MNKKKNTRYQELLTDPRWQKKRLKIFERDSFTCVRCGRQDKTLHAHHKYYIKNRDPWDYKDCVIATLCDPCHKHEHDVSYTNSKALVNAMYDGGFLSDEILLISHSFRDIKHIYHPSNTAAMLSWAIRESEIMEHINELFLIKIGQKLAGDIDEI